ncbi:hypothetical protein GGI08_000762 [Coemansia sp. S2]|nr:hypothetical protein GGI08_000762 [Coemansia sp. S2]
MLRSLILNDQYAFDNDVLFRGNSATLEYPHIIIDKHFLEMCNKSRVFENKHKALRHLIIHGDYSDDELYLISKDDMNKLLNNLVSNAKRLQHGLGFQNIRIFETTFKEMSLSYVLCILKALPAITRLRSGINGVGHMLAQFENDDLPDHIVSTYGDVGSKLEVWEMTSFDSRCETDIINCILLLALVCPNLRREELVPKSVPDYRNKITEALESDQYRKYASQLSHVCDIIYE